MSGVPWTLRCPDCGAGYPGLEIRYRCDCGSALDVAADATATTGAELAAIFESRRASREPMDRSGVWRFRESILPVDPAAIVTRPEGDTPLYDVPTVAAWCGLAALRLKHDGENPTGSFKDRGMTVGVTVARLLGMQRVACASTGNTSASMAAYAAQAGLEAEVLLPKGAVAKGKLAQALAYGARLIEVEGNFDDAMREVEATCTERGTYLLNSLNPFRVEGQKSLGFEIVHERRGRAPDWIVLPGGNLGNVSALTKGLMEWKALGLVDRLPRIAVVQAEGASPFWRAVETGRDLEPEPRPETVASAIRIGNPVSWRRALKGLQACRGVVERVTDPDILDAKRVVDRAGIGAEPASCASVAGLRRLVQRGLIGPDEDVVAVLTGHVLKDPDAVIAMLRGT